MLSWPSCFIVLFNSMLPCWPSPCQTGMNAYKRCYVTPFSEATGISWCLYDFQLILSYTDTHSQVCNTSVIVLKRSRSIFNDFLLHVVCIRHAFSVWGPQDWNCCLFHGVSVGYWFWSYFANAVFVNFGLFFVNTEYQKAKVACQQLIILLTFKGIGKILRTVTVLLWLMLYLQQWWFTSLLPITMLPWRPENQISMSILDLPPLEQNVSLGPAI